MDCPYGNTVRIKGKHEPCGTNDEHCGQCKVDGSYVTEAQMYRLHERDFGGSFDGFAVYSDADSGL